MDIITVDHDTIGNDFDAIYDLEIGEVFKFTKNPETLALRIQDRKPDEVFTFETMIAAPGSDYYTVYGDNTMVVTKKVVAE